jgi:hypothetical protein
MQRLLILVLLLNGLDSFSQKISQSELPSQVKVAFAVIFRGAENESWETDDGKYICNFTREGIKYSSAFNEEGKWLLTESALSVKAIPEAVKVKLKEDYPRHKPKKVFVVQRPQQEILFRLILKKRGKKELHYFNMEGEEIEIKE